MRAVRVIDGMPMAVEVDAPTGEGVRVRVSSAGICGSDLHLIDLGAAPAVTLGHEIAGVTPNGTAVAIEPLLPCGNCEHCREGAYQWCRDATAMIGVAHDGGMADELIVPERCLVPLAAGVDPRDAALVEPLAVAVHGLELAGLRAEHRVAVVGAGTVGLSAVAVAVDAGASVSVVARHDHQRAAAERLGATVVDAAEVESGFDLVVESAGTAEAFTSAARLARRGGTVLLVSMHWVPTPSPGLALWFKELRLLHSFIYCARGGRRDIDDAAALLARRPDISTTLVTHRFPLDAAGEAFSVARDRAAGAIKVILEP